MIDSNQILKLLPNVDCGLCHNPSCATLSRRIFRHTQEPSDCPLVSDDNLNRIRQLLEKAGIEQNNSNNISSEYYDEEIVEIQPCAEHSKVTLEAHLPRPKDSVFELFDSCEMCMSFNNITSLTNVKCSLDMGYGLAERDERRIHIFKTGKIMIRRAKDRTDAVNTLKLVSYSLGPSVICSCGNSLADCLSGGCHACSDHLGSALSWLFKPFDFAYKPSGELLKTIFEKINGNNSSVVNVVDESDKSLIMDRGAEDLETFRKAYKKFQDLLDKFKTADELIKNQKVIELESLRDDLNSDLKDIGKYSNEYLVSDLDHKPRSEALIFLGICRNLKRIIDSMLDLKDSDFNDGLIELYLEASSFVFSGSDAFMRCDYELSTRIETDFKEFSKKLQDRLQEENYPMSLVNLYKLGLNGKFIARIIRIPVPV